MSHLPILPILIPLAAAVALVLLRGGAGWPQRAIGLAASVAGLILALLLLDRVADGQRLVYYLGDWPAPYGIVLVVDRLSALMLALTALLALASLVYASLGDDREGGYFHALFQVQLLGVNGAFLTGDLFNLFVFFEILLIASYALELHGGGRARVRAALHLVVLNLVGSAIFLIGVAAVYAATGTLNLADLALKAAAVGPEQAGLLAAGGLLLLVVFALKAALVPLGLWLPPAYGAASPPVAALFAVLTKVGIYAILRVHGLVFGPDAGPVADLIIPWLLPIGLATVVWGSLGALAARDLGRLFAELMVISAGTLAVALALDAPAAALFYALNSTLVGGGLFLLAGLIAAERGGTGLDDARVVARPGLLGALFFVGAVGVAGLPPLAGFVAKVFILQGSLGHLAAPWVFAVLLGSGLAVMIALGRAGSALFWRAQGTATAGVQANPTLLATLALLCAPAALMIAAGPIVDYTQATATQLADRAGYIEAVLTNPGVGRPLGVAGVH